MLRKMARLSILGIMMLVYTLFSDPEFEILIISDPLTTLAPIGLAADLSDDQIRR